MSRFVIQLGLAAVFLGIIAIPMLLVGCQTYTPEPGAGLPTPAYIQHPPNTPAPTSLPIPSIAGQPVSASSTAPVAPLAPPVPTTSGFAQPPGFQPAPGAPVIGPRAVSGTYVGELLDVIEKTNSVDAFLVAVNVLAAEKPEAREVIPTLIRHAERLGIYDRYAFDKEAPEAPVVQQFTKLVLQMSKEKAAAQPTISAAPQPRPAAQPTDDLEPFTESVLPAEEAQAVQPRFQPVFRSPPPRCLAPTAK